MMGEENKETTKNIQNECGWNKMFKKNVQERRNERQKNQKKKKQIKKRRKKLCVCVFFFISLDLSIYMYIESDLHKQSIM